MDELGWDRGPASGFDLDSLVERRREAEHQRARRDLESTPRTLARAVLGQEPRRHAVLVEDRGRAIGLDALGPAALAAASTLDRRADMRRTAGLVLDPRVARERRSMPDVPAMAAVEPGDMLAGFVAGEADDRASYRVRRGHSPSVLRFALEGHASACMLDAA